MCLIGEADVEIVEATAIYKGLKFAVDRHLLFCFLFLLNQTKSALSNYVRGPYFLGVKFVM